MPEITQPKAQSAMEYLMTYGWAILIIAIVLAALFSLGIFSSGSLIGTTCIANSGFLCGTPIAHGTTFTASIGQATGAQWTNVVLCFVPNGAPAPSSCSGYPSVTAGNLQSGESGTFSFTLSSSSPTASGYIWAQYDEATYTGLMSEVATVTMKGLTPSSSSTPTSSTSTGPTIPSGIAYYANVVITNSQSSATPAPFQQEVQIPESDYSNYISYNGVSANFEFFSSSGSVIPAWIESNSSGTLTAWLNIAGGIPASNSITVYLGFAPKSTNLLSSSGTSGIGEAPQLSSTYAQYDDGADVFNSYWNFAGTSLPSGWINNGGVTATVNNGLTLSYGSAQSPAGWSSASITYQNLNLHSTNSIVEGLLSFSSITEYTRGLLFITSNANNAYSISSTTYVAVLSDPDAYAAYQQSAGSGATGIGTQQFSAGNYAIAGIVNLASANQIIFTYNYNSITSTLQAGSVNSYYLALGFGESSDPSVSVTWLRIRAYPPNGVMPGVSFGAVASS